MKMRIHLIRHAAAIACFAAVFSGCDTVDELLEAKNPAEIREDQLDDETLVNVLVNSVTGALTDAYAGTIIWIGSLPTDEQVSGINWPETQQLGRRFLPYDGDDAENMFDALSVFRFMADSVSGRLRNLLENPSSDRRLALTLAYAGYAYTFMAEYMCEATINVGPDIYTPNQLAGMAIERFQEAISIATAAGSSADDVKNLAYVGLARAATAAGQTQQVMDAAAQVPSDFVWWVEYKDQIADNDMRGNVTGGNHNLGVHPRFLAAFGTYGDSIPIANQTDPRIQFNPAPRKGHDGSTLLYTPYQSLPYSDYNGHLQTDAEKPILYTDDTDIRLGSYLDAMHNYYEAAGAAGTGPEGTTLEFVNARRAVGNQPPVALSGDALMAELREQRGRDLYLGGFRMGDLRRWKAQGLGDFFPSGPHPNPILGDYADMECFPLPIQEYIGNPNIGR